jgi:hypothetical protein
MHLKKLVFDLKKSVEFKRKGCINKVIKKFGPGYNFMDDAGTIKFRDKYLLLSTDGIVEQLIYADPEFAGFCSVLVNVNDIIAMGGKPLAIVDYIAYSKEEYFEKILAGIKSALKKFGLTLLGGHVNPSCSYNSIVISILGHTNQTSLLTCQNVKLEDVILYIVDLNGRIHNKFPFAWDTTSWKSKSEINLKMACLMDLASKNLVNACRDVSNAGILGSLTMLLEISGKGAIVDLSKIIVPSQLDFIHWLKVYPGMGFIYTAPESNVGRIKDLVDGYFSMSIIGKIKDSKKLWLKFGDKKALFFNFNYESIFQDYKGPNMAKQSNF